MDRVTVTLRARAKGLPRIDLIGMCGARARESLARLRSAFDASGLRWPRRPVLIEIDGAPSSGPEPLLDLPIGVALAAAAGDAPIADVLGLAMAGEVGLDGSLQGTPGMLLCACAMGWGGDRDLDGVCLPTAAAEWLGACPPWMLTHGEPIDAGDFADEMIPDEPWRGVFVSPSLASVVEGQLTRVVSGSRDHRGDEPHVAVGNIVVLPPEIQARPPAMSGWDEIVGQEAVKRALAVALAGGHSALLWGPPGCGKSRLVHGAHALLPTAYSDEARAVCRGQSDCRVDLPASRPCSILTPGSRPEPMPGANRRESRGRESDWWEHAAGGIAGVDEVDRAPDAVISSVMEHLDATVPLWLAGQELAARPIFLATTNERPHDQRCRIPGGLLDRIDLVVGVSAVASEAALSSRSTIPVESIAASIAVARQRQLDRGGLNALACRATLAKVFPAKGEASRLLREAGQEKGLSVRAIDALRRVAWTIADLDGQPPGDPRHVLEALTWRWAMPEGYSGKPGAKPRRMAFSQQARGSTN